MLHGTKQSGRSRRARAGFLYVDPEAARPRIADANRDAQVLALKGSVAAHCAAWERLGLAALQRQRLQPSARPGSVPRR